MTETSSYHVIDSFGRSYYEGQTFPTRDAAIARAHRIAEHDRAHGVWVASEDEDDAGEEIYPAEG